MMYNALMTWLNKCLAARHVLSRFTLDIDDALWDVFYYLIYRVLFWMDLQRFIKDKLNEDVEACFFEFIYGEEFDVKQGVW